MHFDWNYVLHQSPARIVAIAAFVATTLQLLKRYFPLLGGWWAVATNVAFSSALVIAASTPDTLFTPQTIANVAIAALGAAGIHGTGKLMFADAGEQKLSSPTIATKLPVVLLFVGLLGVATVGLGGCNSWERQTYQTLAATQATVNQAQADYENATIPRNEISFLAINRAKEAQTLAVNSFASYERLKGAKGSQTAIDAQQQLVAQALAMLPDLIANIKALYTPPTAGIKLPVGPQPFPAAAH